MKNLVHIDRDTSQQGQVLVLAAFMMVVLIGITGLAIDVSAAYLTERVERSIADASALAGAQDLQKPGSRALPDAGDYAKAKTNAMRILVSELEANATPTAGACFTSVSCPLPGTPYEVSIQTPAPAGSCRECQPERAVQVTVRQPSFGLSFGRIFSQSNWVVSSTSLAGVVHPRIYGMVTLRPPNPRTNGTDPNEKNIDIGGGSIVKVVRGDVATNTNMSYSGTNSTMVLEDGYAAYHYNPVKFWSGSPRGVSVTTLVEDPGFAIPTRLSSTPVYQNLAAAKGTDHDTRCPRVKQDVPPQYKIRTGVSIKDMPNNKVTCLRPGVYSFTNNGGQPVSHTNTDEAYLLEPGVYWFDRGMDMKSTMVGGWKGGQPGVGLVFLEAKNQNGSVPGQLTANNSDLFALNYGDAYKNAGGPKATAAIGPQGLVQSSGPRPAPMSLMVVPDSRCYVAPQEPSTCDASQNKTINLPGGGELWVAGIQYAPTDNIVISGNATTEGVVGQIIAWTITYNSSFLNLEASPTERNGVLRLDSGCSPTLPCTP